MSLCGMKYAAGRLYVSKIFNNESKEAATEMIDYIRNEFKTVLGNNDWIDNSSEDKALDKVCFFFGVKISVITI
jgi:predicted metalloendopeptidase